MKRFLVCLTISLLPGSAAAQWLPADREKHTQELLSWSGVDLGKPVRFYECTPAVQRVANVDNGRGKLIPSYLLHDANYPIDATHAGGRGYEPSTDNLNLLRLWRRPGGLSNTSREHWRNATAVYLPGPLKVWSGTVNMPGAGDLPTWRWSYPEGTIVVDMLIRKHGGEEWPFEVRVREKKIGGEWDSTAFRPYATEADLPKGSEKQKWTMASQSGEKLSMIGIDRLEAQAWSLPKGTDHSEWKAFRPSRIIATSAADDAPIPPGYAGNMVSCQACHKNAGQASEYASVLRGDDENFSFHPFEPSSVSTNGFSRKVSFRADVIDPKAGLPTGEVAATGQGAFSTRTVIGGGR